ncbi:class I SAM-dependent methyltransferase [Micromonospora sp. NPDC005299]|uniref:class I SAM-dependent methyltransferase n=1 Tax=Micromonospora sp. NPDC005299 TaxID=3364231 RepID=UPI0036CB09B3
MISGRILVRWWWSGYAAVYDWLWAGPITDGLAETIRTQAAPVSGPVLDAGTGTGLIAARLASLGSVIGIDSNLAMLTRAARRPGIWMVAQAERPPLEPGSVATVVAANLIHLCREPDAVLDALAVLLCPGGRLIVSWPADEVGAWRIARAERASGAGLGKTGARFAVRVAVAVSAAGTGSVRRTPTHRVLGAIRSVAATRGLRDTHDTALDGLQRLAVLSRPTDRSLETP